MRHSILILGLIVALLAGTFPIPFALAAGNTYYVDVNHANARDDTNHGSLDRPWKTLDYAFRRLRPGDTLLVRGGTYRNNFISLRSSNSGREGAPITVQAYPGEQVIVQNGSGIRFYAAHWWVIDGLVFEQYTARLFGLGSASDSSTAVTNIAIKNCEFRNSNLATFDIRNASYITLENNYFHNIRTGVSGKDLSTINIPYLANRIVIKNNRFEEIGSDAIHLATNGNSPGANVASVIIIGNEFWVNRPYTGPFGNVGENAIDVKWAQGPIVIIGNEIHGFRPTVSGQDSSGDSSGAGLRIQNSARNVIVERNLFYDNTGHIVIAQNKGSARVSNVVVRNNIFREARQAQYNGRLVGGYAISAYGVQNIEIYHNTFYDNYRNLQSKNLVNGAFKNNILFRGTTYLPDPTVDWDADYNAWSNISRIPPLLQGSHDLRVGDLELDTNLRPQAGSPVINAGQNLGVPDDFAATPRSDGSPDLGAYEYVP